MRPEFTPLPLAVPMTGRPRQLLLARAAALGSPGLATLAVGVFVGGWLFVTLGSISLCLALNLLAASQLPRADPA